MIGRKLVHLRNERVSEGREQWYVITGPPCCGKSTTVQLLARRGFRVRTEVARDYVDEEISKGRTLQDIRSDMRKFQCEVLLRARASEETLPKDELIFLDRGTPDSLAYFWLHGIPVDPYLDYIRSSKYAQIFFLDPIDEYQTDYARVESLAERDQLASLLWQAYSDLDFCIERVPAGDREERVNFIKQRIGSRLIPK